jgi:UDP-N-acetyl-D-galactosamine dehydrogenase
VTVPTPIDERRQPDLTPVQKACMTVGKVLKKNDIVVFESTVYPGVTEEYCGPILAQESGLTAGKDFFLGYSPERINPGDKVNKLENIIKIIAGQTKETTERMNKIYGTIIHAGLHIAPTIKVAEAAKVIENTQRDLNIALMNELSIIFDMMDLKTSDVLAAAGTKWNFLKFTPGLVGGHCIGVDPYYLTAKAEMLGYHPQVILAGRRINDSMAKHVGEKIIKLLIKQDKSIKKSKVGILGLTFKENVPDLRNSKVPDIAKTLNDYGISAFVHDPFADKKEAYHEYQLNLSDLSDFKDLDALIVAVPHAYYLNEIGLEKLKSMVKKDGIIFDVKSLFEAESFSDYTYAAL